MNLQLFPIRFFFVKGMETPSIEVENSEDDKTYPVGSDIHLKCNTTSFPEITSFKWYKDNILVQDSTSNDLILHNALVKDSGNYTCRASNHYNTRTSIGLNLTIWGRNLSLRTV